MTLQSKQNLEQCVVHETSNSDLSDQIARISTTVQNSAIEARQQFSAHHDQIRAISDQHTRVVKAGLQDLGESTAVIQNQFQGAIESLQQSLTVQLSKTHDNSQALHSTLQELLQQIRSSEKNPPQNNLSDELQDCIDRLYATNNAAAGDLNINSSEAQLVTEDLVIILKTLLEEVNLPCPIETRRKRKFDRMNDDEAAEAEAGIKQRRVFKRMRGILESSQGVQIRDSSQFS